MWPARIGVVAAVAACVVLTAGEAMAKPKKPATVNGCTAEQIQAPSAAPCINQLQQDIIDGVAYPHALFCDETGVYCCQSDGTRTFGCKKVSAKSQTQPLTPLAPGTLQRVQ